MFLHYLSLQLGLGVLFGVAMLLFVVFLIRAVYLVKQAEAIVIERLGK